MKGALRRICRDPAVPALVAVMLGLGIGAAAVGFALAKTVWLWPLPYRAAGQLVNIWAVNRSYPLVSLGPGPDVAPEVRKAPTVEDTTEYQTGTAVWMVGSQPLQLGTTFVAPNFFDFFGQRTPTPPTSGAVISEEVAERLGGRERALGRIISWHGLAYTVVGVAPVGFQFPDFLMPGRSARSQIWVKKPDSRQAAGPTRLAEGAPANSGVLIRLRPRASMAMLDEELSTISGRLHASGKLDPAWRLVGSSLVQEELGSERTPAAAIFLASLLVLGIAFVNAVTLLAERTARRRAEVGLRLALGAGGRSIMSELAAESLWLSLCGGVLGLGIACAAIPALRGLLPPASALHGVSPDWLMAAFVALLIILTVGLMGTVIIRRALGEDPAALLRGGLVGRGIVTAKAGRRGVVIFEVALATLLIAASIALVQTFTSIASAPIGMQPDRVIAVWLFAPPRRSGPSGSPPYYEPLLGALAKVPGVQTVAASSVPVLEGASFNVPPARTSLATVTRYSHRAVTAGYFQSLGMRLQAGRSFDDNKDRLGAAPVAVVNRAFAVRGWAGQDAVGRRIHLSWEGRQLEYRVIGVVDNARDNLLRDVPAPEILTPLLQAAAVPQSVTILLRTATPPTVQWTYWRQAIADRIWRLEGDVPIASIRPLSAVVTENQAEPRLRALFLTCFAGLGLVLATIGVFAVFAHWLTRTERGLAICLALGAPARRLFAGTIWSGAKVCFLGVGLGLIAALLAGHFFQSLLLGATVEFSALFGAALLTAVAGLTACCLSGLRIFGIDPAQTLRRG